MKGITIENQHGTDPLIQGKEYITFYGSVKIQGTLVQSSCRKHVYLQCEAKSNNPAYKTEIRTHLVQRLHLIPSYRLN